MILRRSFALGLGLVAATPAFAFVRALEGAQGRVRSGNRLGDQSTGAVTPPPNQVLNLAHGTATQTTMPLTWDAPSGTILDYLVQYGLHSSGVWTSFIHAASNTASITVTGLTIDTSYDFRVAAVGAGGIGAFSSTLNASTLPLASALLLETGGFFLVLEDGTSEILLETS